MRNSLKKNYAYNVVYQLVNIMVPFITTPYVSRILGVNAIGNYSFTASIVSYFAMFAMLGFSIYGQRETAYHAKDRIRISILFYEIQLYKLLSTIVCTLTFVVYVQLLADDSYKTSLYIQTLTIIAVFFDISWLFQGLEDFKVTVLRNLLVKLAGVIAIFAFVHEPGDIELYIALHCGIILLGNISLWVYLPQHIVKVNKTLIRPFAITRRMLELFIPLIAVQVYNVLDKTMIGIITNSSYENGCYEQTTKIITIIMALITSLGTVMLPRMASVYAEDDRQNFKKLAEKAFYYVILVSCPLCFGLISVSDSFVPFFFGNGYDKVVPLIKIYALVILIIPLSNIAGYAILTPTGRQNKGTFAVICGAITNFICNQLLIPRLLSIGAAIATIVAELIVTVVHLIFIRNDISVFAVLKWHVRQMCISGTMCLVVLIVGSSIGECIKSDAIILCTQVVTGVVVFAFLQFVVVKDQMVIEIVNRMIPN